MKLFLRHDLFKNIVTIQGQKYDVSSEQKEGYEPYQASDGSTMYRKLVGQGGSATEQKLGQQLNKPVEKDPAKVGQDFSQTQVDPENAKDTLVQPVASTIGGENTKTQSKAAPFELDEKAHANTDPMEHYKAAKVMDELGDAKGAAFHRDQAAKKTADFDGTMHADIRDKLQAAGMHDDASKHDMKRKQSVMSQAREGQLAGEAAARGAPAPQASQPQPGSSIPKTQAMQGIPDTRESEAIDGAAPNDTVSDKTVPDQAAQQAAQAGVSPPLPGQDVPPRQQGKDVSSEAFAQTQPSTAAADAAQAAQTEDKISAAQKKAQQKATEDFKKKQSEHEVATQKHADEIKDYEDKLKEHKQAREDHAKELENIKSKLNDVKQGKPVRDDSEERAIQKQVKAKKRELDLHNESKPTDPTVKHKQKINDMNADFKKQSAEQKKELGYWNDRLKEHEDAVKRVKEKAPEKPKDEAEQKTYEKRMKNHQAQLKKVTDARDRAKQAVEDHKSKMSAAKDAHTQKVDSVKAQISTMEKDYKSKLDAHAKKKQNLKEEHRNLTDKYVAAQQKSKDAHQKAMDAHAKKVAAANKELADHKKAKDKLPEAPKKPSNKAPEATHRTPETDQEKLSHENHTKAAATLASNIESHLRENKDLSPEQRNKLHKLHEHALQGAHQQHLPTKEDKQMLQNVQKQAAEHGAHEHHDVKAQADAKVQEQQKKVEAQKQAKAERTKAKEDKAKAQAQATQPRPPENDMEEAQVHEHATAAKQKMQELQDHLDSGNVSDEDRKHIENAIKVYGKHADQKTVPTKDEQNELKQTDKVMGRHLKDAKQSATSGGAEKEPKDKSAADGEKTKTSRSSDRRAGSKLLSSWNRGVAAGEAWGQAATSAGKAGGYANIPARGISGAISAGHHMLSSPNKKFQAQEDTSVSDQEIKDDQAAQEHQDRMDAIANARKSS